MPPAPRNFFAKFNAVKRECVDVGNEYLIDLNTQIVDFLLSTPFHTARSDYSYVEYFLMFDSSKEVAREMDKPSKTVENNMKRMSDALFALFGNDFFDLYRDVNTHATIADRLAEVKLRFAPPTPIRSLVHPMVLSVARATPFDDSVEFKDCGYEAKVLYETSVARVSRSIEKCDPAKLRFLVDILEGKGMSDDFPTYKKFTDTIKSAPAVGSTKPVSSAKPEPSKRIAPYTPVDMRGSADV